MVDFIKENNKKDFYDFEDMMNRINLFLFFFFNKSIISTPTTEKYHVIICFFIKSNITISQTSYSFETYCEYSGRER